MSTLDTFSVKKEISYSPLPRQKIPYTSKHIFIYPLQKEKGGKEVTTLNK